MSKVEIICGTALDEFWESDRGEEFRYVGLTPYGGDKLVKHRYENDTHVAFEMCHDTDMDQDCIHIIPRSMLTE